MPTVTGWSGSLTTPITQPTPIQWTKADTNGAAAASLVATLPNNVGTGRVVLVFIALASALATTKTVNTMTATGATFSRLSNHQYSGTALNNQEVWFGTGMTAAAITITPSASINMECIVVEIANVALTLPLDSATYLENGSLANQSGTAITPNQANNIFFGFYSDDAATPLQTVKIAQPYNLLHVDLSINISNDIAVAYYVNPSTVSSAPAFTISNTAVAGLIGTFSIKHI